MRAVYVDTGIWVALIDAADPMHSRAEELIERTKGLPLLANELVFSETVTLLRREVGPDVAGGFGRDFLSGRIGTLLRSEERDWRAALKIIEKYREHKVSAADAVSAAMIRRLAISKVASFDKHFRILLADREVLGPRD